MIFVLRGRSKEELIAALSENRKAVSMREENKSDMILSTQERNQNHAPLEYCIEYYWTEPKPSGHFAVSPKGPYVNAALIKRLGEPSFWREPQNFTELMEDIYQKVTTKALKIAFS